MFNEEPTAEQLADACMWNNHAFGLYSDEEKRKMMWRMREHWRAIWKACNTPGRGKEFLPPNQK